MIHAAEVETCGMGRTYSADKGMLAALQQKNSK
jgi:hypothetical protein